VYTKPNLREFKNGYPGLMASTSTPHISRGSTKRRVI
jgi:hypothetical protein